ncbi:hypothetical protein GCM10020218_102270 [Dactylosporangium vinaceum]
MSVGVTLRTSRVCSSSRTAPYGSRTRCWREMVYADATAAARRETHERLADTVTDPVDRAPAPGRRPPRAR